MINLEPMLPLVSHSSSLQIKDSDGNWVSAGEFGVTENLRLLETEDTILGRLFVPIKRGLEKEPLSDPDLKPILDKANSLASGQNSLLKQGVFFLLDSKRDQIRHLLVESPERWSEVAPYVLRRESYSVRSIILAKLVKDNLEVFDACRYLGTNEGARILERLIADPKHQKDACCALAAFPKGEVPNEVRSRLAELKEKFPILGALFFEKQSDAQDQLSGKILLFENSFLPDGIVFANKRFSIDANNPEELEASSRAICSLAVETIRARGGRPPQASKGSRLRVRYEALLTPDGAKCEILKFVSSEIPKLFETLGIGAEDSALIPLCLHDRCKAALVDDEERYNQAIYEWIGKWNWVSKRLESISPNQMLDELRALAISGEGPPVGEIIGKRGDLSSGLQINSEVNSVAAIASITGLSEDEVFRREKDAFNDRLPSIGLELQNFEVPIENFSAWKDFLRSHGIPSPNRPEFGALVEASLPPCFSVKNIVELLNTLEEMDFFSFFDNRMAIHVSLGVPVTEDLKYIAIGLLSFFEPEFDPEVGSKEWLRSLKNLFSKGLIFRNTGTKGVHPEFSHGDSHAEIRVIYAENYSTSDILWCLESGLLAAQLLGRELASGYPSDFFLAFKEQIEIAQRDFGIELLNADWIIGTGDPFDESVMQEVPLVRELVDYRKACIERPKDMKRFHARVREILLSVAY